MNIKKLVLAALAVVAGASLPAAVPEISGVTMTQASDRRPAYRGGNTPTARNNIFGFRVLCSAGLR